jgi:hypothetical protein
MFPLTVNRLTRSLPRLASLLTLGFTLGFTLGCAGLSEWTFETTTGGAMELTENGVVLVMEDGTRVTSRAGADLSLPDDFPVIAPWENAVPTSSTFIESPDGQEAETYSFDLERPPDDVIAHYRAWMSQQGIETIEQTDVTAMGTRVISLKAKDALENTISVAVNQFFGLDSLVLQYGADLEP